MSTERLDFRNFSLKTGFLPGLCVNLCNRLIVLDLKTLLVSHIKSHTLSIHSYRINTSFRMNASKYAATVSLL